MQNKHIAYVVIGILVVSLVAVISNQSQAFQSRLVAPNGSTRGTITTPVTNRNTTTQKKQLAPATRTPTNIRSNVAPTQKTPSTTVTTPGSTRTAPATR